MAICQFVKFRKRFIPHIGALFFISIVNHVRADDLMFQRLCNLTNHLNRLEQGVRMVVEYTQFPDVPRRAVESKSFVVRPSTNTLAEILVRGNDFWFDWSIGEPFIVTASGVTRTNPLYMVGRDSLFDAAGNAIGSRLYYWNPKRQFSFTKITNGLPSPGGWVESLFQNTYDTGVEVARLSLPEFDSHAIKIIGSNAIIRSAAGELRLDVISNGATNLDLKLSATADPNSYQISRFLYAHPNDPLPKSFDTYFYVTSGTQVVQSVHYLFASIKSCQYLAGMNITNPPQKVVDDIDTPKYRGLFEVYSNGQVQIVGTNSIPVTNNSTSGGASTLGRVFILIFSLTSLAVLLVLTRGSLGSQIS